MAAVTMSCVMSQPVGFRQLLAKYLAPNRWVGTCNFWDSLSIYDRITVCFHAGLKKSHAMTCFSELSQSERESIVCAIDDLRKAFAKYRKHGVSNTTFLSWLTAEQRKTLFKHAGLSEREYMQPYCYVDKDGCEWAGDVIRAMKELFHLFDDAPSVLSAVKPEEYA